MLNAVGPSYLVIMNDDVVGCVPFRFSQLLEVENDAVGAEVHKIVGEMRNTGAPGVEVEVLVGIRKRRIVERGDLDDVDI